MTRNASPETLGVGWIEWSGGSNPAPGQRVEVRLRLDEGRPRFEASRASSGYRWSHHKSATHEGNGDIIAYRVVETPAPNTEGMKATSGRNEPKADKSQTDMGERVAEMEAGLREIADSAGVNGERGTTGDGHQKAIQIARALLNPKLEG